MQVTGAKNAEEGNIKYIWQIQRFKHLEHEERSRYKMAEQTHFQGTPAKIRDKIEGRYILQQVMWDIIEASNAWNLGFRLGNNKSAKKQWADLKHSSSRLIKEDAIAPRCFCQKRIQITLYLWITGRHSVLHGAGAYGLTADTWATLRPEAGGTSAAWLEMRSDQSFTRRCVRAWYQSWLIKLCFPPLKSQMICVTAQNHQWESQITLVWKSYLCCSGTKWNI